TSCVRWFTESNIPAIKTSIKTFVKTKNIYFSLVSSQLGIILDCFVNYAINAVKCHKIDK
ncbi:MAG: hypothetical protein RPR97_08495, partial [Colwellia sp.]